MAKPKSGQSKTEKTVKILRVAAKHDGFRRAGYEFGREAKDISVTDLKKEQIEQIKNDPSLVCVEVDVPGDAGGANEEVAE